MDTYINKAIAVDASCLGNPGIVRYKGLIVDSKEVIFDVRVGYGTNNLGEFLAIVHAIKWLTSKVESYPIYSDSTTGINWVVNKKVRTTLQRDEKTNKIYTWVDKALVFLKDIDLREYSILKWDTRNWGEIPADFGEKK